VVGVRSREQSGAEDGYEQITTGMEIGDDNRREVCKLYDTILVSEQGKDGIEGSIIGCQRLQQRVLSKGAQVDKSGGWIISTIQHSHGSNLKRRESHVTDELHKTHYAFSDTDCQIR
jgi:hypothetical protein